MRLDEACPTMQKRLKMAEEALKKDRRFTMTPPEVCGIESPVLDGYRHQCKLRNGHPSLHKCYDDCQREWSTA
jgi:hypothetical protein